MAMAIDVATGAVTLEARDIHITGRFPLTWERTFSSGMLDQEDSHLGPGWTNAYFTKLTRVGKDYQFRGPGGALVQFPDPDDSLDRDGVIRDLGSFHEIARQGYYLRITHWSTNGKITRYLFAPGRNGQWWPLRWIEDAAGNGLELAWDEQGRLKGIRQKHEKRTLAVAYSAAGRIAAIAFRYPDNRLQTLVRYEYDGSGRMCLAKNALEGGDRYEYEASGHVRRELAKDGGIFTYRYDEKGRCIRMSGLDNYDLKVLRYLDHIRWTEVTNSLGSTHRYQWLATGQVSLHIDPLGAKSETEYDDLGRILSKTGPLGEKTVYAYDEAGNRHKHTDALGNETVFEYNAHHQVIKQVDANSQAWVKEYDASNRPIAAVDPLGNRCGIEYDPAGNPILLKKADGSESRRTYSEAGNLVEIIDWAGGRTRMNHDEYGRVVERREPDGRTSKRQYDLLGRVTQIAYDTGMVVKYRYDVAGNVLSVTSSAESPVHFTYGTCRRLLEKRFGAGQAVRFSWGTEPERLETVTNELGEQYRFQYDACDRIIAETGFDGRKTVFEYGLSGHCIARTNALGQTIAWERDPLGRIIKETLDGEFPSSFEFDKAGNLVFASNDWSSIRFERDGAGRATKESQGGIDLAREYGPMGEVLHLETNAGARFDYAYDGFGLVQSVEAEGFGTFEYSRNDRQDVSGLSMPGGLRLEQSHDSRGRLLKQVLHGNAPDQEALVEREYTYDLGGMLQSEVDAKWGTSRFAHDETRRLIRFATDGSRWDFLLNPAGDPIALSRNGEEEARIEYGPGGELRRRPPYEYDYDGAGRMIAKREIRDGTTTRAWSFTWDAKDRLLSAVTPDGGTWSYGYDPFGRRCLKKGPEREIRYVWDKDVLLHELEAGKETLTWGFQPHGFKPLFKIQGGKLFPIILDRLGTPREMLDGDSRVIWSIRLDPWGNPLDGKGRLEDCPFRLPGQYYDAETGLHYNRFRYFDPTTGRYLSRDPILLAGGFSTYRYVNNPTKWIDPFGLCEDENEVLYRTMSQEDFEELQRTGRMPATTETTTSPTQSFSEDYDGVLVEFQLKPGTIAQLESIGVSDGSPLVRSQYPDMPIGGKGWNREHARFKGEGTQINIALGKGDALDIFNDNITDYNVIRP